MANYTTDRTLNWWNKYYRKCACSLVRFICSHKFTYFHVIWHENSAVLHMDVYTLSFDNNARSIAFFLHVAFGLWHYTKNQFKCCVSNKFSVNAAYVYWCVVNAVIIASTAKPYFGITEFRSCVCSEKSIVVANEESFEHKHNFINFGKERKRQKTKSKCWWWRAYNFYLFSKGSQCMFIKYYLIILLIWLKYIFLPDWNFARHFSTRIRTEVIHLSLFIFRQLDYTCFPKWLNTLFTEFWIWFYCAY